MSERFDRNFKEFQQMYNSGSKEWREAFSWFLENWKIVERITSTFSLTDTEINKLLQKDCIGKEDFVFKLILLYQKFMQEHILSDELTE